MGEDKNTVPEQMETVQLNVDPPAPAQQPQPSSEPSTASGDAQPPVSTPGNDLARKLLGVFAVANALGIFLWFMAGAGFPWFIYITYGVAVISSIIYGVKTKDSFFANWSIFLSTNVMLFITFLACGGGYPWFMMPLCSLAIFPVSQYIWQHYGKPLRYLYIHAAIYLLINAMLFFIWVTDSLHNPYPWFIYPWCGWGVLLLVQYNHAVMHDKSRLFVFICADLGVMLMITFRFAIGPLFMVFLLLAFIAAVLYYLFLKKGYAAHCWCVKRNKQTLPTDQPTPSSSSEVPPTQPPQGGFMNFALPQFHVQLQPPGYQNVAPAPPAGAVYFAAGQAPYPYQTSPPVAPGGHAYYAYFPSNNVGQLYPTISPAPVPASAPAPIPVPVPNDAVLTSDANNTNEKKEKEEEEDSHLLRNSPSRSYGDK